MYHGLPWYLAAAKLRLAEKVDDETRESAITDLFGQICLPSTPWEPSYFPADAVLHRNFRQDSVGRLTPQLLSSSGPINVTVFIRSMAAMGDLLMESIEHDRGAPETIQGCNGIVMKEEIINSRSGQLLIWHWYWIDGRFCENDYMGKLLQAMEKIQLRGDDGAAVFIYSSFVDSPDEARKTFGSFRGGNLYCAGREFCRQYKAM